MRDDQTALFSAVAAAVGENTGVFDAFTRLFSGTDPEVIGKLLEYVDESDYALADWVIALGEFDCWLENSDEPSRPVAEMLGYIHCCTRMLPPGISLASLKVIVCKALTDFGFKAVFEAQN